MREGERGREREGGREGGGVQGFYLFFSILLAEELLRASSPVQQSFIRVQRAPQQGGKTRTLTNTPTIIELSHLGYLMADLFLSICTNTS